MKCFLHLGYYTNTREKKNQPTQSTTLSNTKNKSTRKKKFQVSTSTMNLLFSCVMICLMVIISSSTAVHSQNTTTSTVITTVTSASSAPPSTTSSPANTFGISYGDGIDLQLNTTVNLKANKCMGLNSNLRHPDLKLRGATVRKPICIPSNVNKTKGWLLSNGTATRNINPTDDQVDNCIATCSTETSSKQKASTVTVIYSFGNCYCWNQDFHDEHDVDKDAQELCCKDGRVYEDYLLLAGRKCVEQMYANVYVTSLLCPLNGSLCSTTLAKDTCETTSTSAAGVTGNFDCCIPEGSLQQAPTWGLQVAQYTIIIICVLALFQVLYWIFRKRRDDEQDQEEERRREEQPRLLIVPTVMTNASAGDSSPASPTETQTITQIGTDDTHAIQAAKEIVALYKMMDAVEVAELEGTGQEDCSVCIDPLKNSQSVKTPCHHMFHKNCLFQYIAHKLRDKVRHVTCPVCRAVLVDASINEDAPAGANGTTSTQRQQEQQPLEGFASSSSSLTSRRRQQTQRDQSNPLQRSLLSGDTNDNVEMTSPRPGVAHRGSSRRVVSGSNNSNLWTSESLGGNNQQQQLTPRGAHSLL